MPVKTSRRKYGVDFRKEVLCMIEMGRSVPDAAVSLGIGANLIYEWRKRSKKKEAFAGEPQWLFLRRKKQAFKSASGSWSRSGIF